MEEALKKYPFKKAFKKYGLILVFKAVRFRSVSFLKSSIFNQSSSSSFVVAAGMMSSVLLFDKLVPALLKKPSTLHLPLDVKKKT